MEVPAEVAEVPPEVATDVSEVPPPVPVATEVPVVVATATEVPPLPTAAEVPVVAVVDGRVIISVNDWTAKVQYWLELNNAIIEGQEGDVLFVRKANGTAEFTLSTYPNDSSVVASDGVIELHVSLVPLVGLVPVLNGVEGPPFREHLVGNIHGTLFVLKSTFSITESDGVLMPYGYLSWKDLQDLRNVFDDFSHSEQVSYGAATDKTEWWNRWKAENQND